MKSILIFLLLAGMSFAAKKLYVSTSGNDAITYTVNDISHPWLTPQRAWYQALAGDSVFFRAGTYTITANINTGSNGNNGTAGSPITFTHYPAEAVSFVASAIQEIQKSHNVVDGFTLTSPGTFFRLGYDYSITGFTIKNCNFRMTTGGDNCGLVYGNHVTTCLVYNCRMYGPGSGAHQNSAGAIFFNTVGCTVRKCNISNFPIGIYYKHGGGLPAHSLGVFDSNFFWQCSRYSIEANIGNATFSNNVFGKNNQAFRIFEANGGPLGDSNSIRYNVFYSGGLYLAYDGAPGATYSEVHHNIFNTGASFQIFPNTGNPTSDNTHTDTNTYVGNVYIKNINVNRYLSAWRAYSGKDSHSDSVGAISWNNNYSDTLMQHYLVGDTTPFPPPPPCYIDSIRPALGRTNTSFKLYGVFGTKAGNDSIKLNSVVPYIHSWTNDSIRIDSVPSSTSRGFYAVYLTKAAVRVDTVIHGFQIKKPALGAK